MGAPSDFLHFQEVKVKSPNSFTRLNVTTFIAREDSLPDRLFTVRLRRGEYNKEERERLDEDEWREMEGGRMDSERKQGSM